MIHVWALACMPSFGARVLACECVTANVWVSGCLSIGLETGPAVSYVLFDTHW